VSDPDLFAPGPARDERFDVKERWAEMANFPEEHPESLPEFLHRQMNEEMNGLEIAARNLADFPDADWELRMAVARQCWDEARHVDMFRRSFEARGGQVGRYPVLNFQYRILMKIDTLVGRLAVQNRSFEAAGIDAIHEGMADAARHGQDDMAELLDTQLADEIQHVRYANRWIDVLVQRGGPRAAFDLARAVAQANQALAVVAGGAMVRYAVAEEVRREAGFTDAEIETVKGFPERV
jgi:uncharacterized ferritin-like protein (DUF455 family)